MPRLKAPIYNVPATRASTRRNGNFWNDSSSRCCQLHQSINGESPPRRGVRTYRTWLWGLAAGLKAFGVLAALLIAMRTSWSGFAAAVAILAGVTLRFILEATSYGD